METKYTHEGGDNSFITDSMRYSYSSASSFNTCKYGFKLTYIDAKEREGNFFSDYGLLVHDILERYFGGKLMAMELAQFYKDNFEKNMKHELPPYPKGMKEKYYQEGLEFFESFEFPVEEYEVVSIEDTVKTNHKDSETGFEFELTVKPDLVLRHKESGEYILFDYKTSKLRHNSTDKKKMEGYKKQFVLYAYYLWIVKGIEISKIKVWFTRNNELIDIPFNQFDYADVIGWFEDTIRNIKNERDWNPTSDKSAQYFCENICGVRSHCIYKKPVL